MFDAHSKEDLKRSVANISNQADTTVLIHELAAIARAILIEEINKRPDDPKPEETPAETPVEASDDEPHSRRRQRERA